MKHCDCGAPFALTYIPLDATEAEARVAAGKAVK